MKAQCLWDVAIKMKASIDSTNVLVANMKPLKLRPYIAGSIRSRLETKQGVFVELNLDNLKQKASVWFV